jgi:hypothetical protein
MARETSPVLVAAVLYALSLVSRRAAVPAGAAVTSVADINVDGRSAASNSAADQRSISE